jgi:protein-S-isoprenylcysteine O-methyltransferase Ste14
MTLNWRAFEKDHPHWFAIAVFAKRARTKVALVLAIWCLGEGAYDMEQPLDLLQPDVWLFAALSLIAAGVSLRIAAHGRLRKKRDLATDGVYSLCRHPLYLGSILLTLGFCVLFDDGANYLIAGAYFLAFYPLTIAWEEVRLGERYGVAHRTYCETTPLLLPLGRFRRGEFRWIESLRRGGAALLVGTAGLVGFAASQQAIMRLVMRLVAYPAH